MEKIIVDGEEIMVEEREELETPVSSITVEEKHPKWSLKKTLLFLGGAILGAGLTAWAVIATSNSKTEETEESFDEDDDGDDSTENDSFGESESTTKTDF